MALTVHGNQVDGIFRLLGADENSATYAVGWALDRCPTFCDAFLKKTVRQARPPGSDQLTFLQRRDKDLGYTDIELRFGDAMHVVVEAKAGWTLPSPRQLRRYSKRFRLGGKTVTRLVTLSAMPSSIAALHGTATIGPIPVTHLSWTDVRTMARKAHAATRRIEEKRWLREVVQHLEEFVAMDRRSSNEVYVVSLSNRPILRGNPYSWIDVVEKDDCYFHPVGSGWPAEPPNYVAFRYRGGLRSVHHVDKATIVTDLRRVNIRWPRTNRPHFIYRLGAPMLPAKEVRTGIIFRNARVRCAIDTLLSGEYSTIAQARDATKLRLEHEAS